MIADHFQELEKFESGLWKIADNLRANSNLASNEYFMPIMGLIFLRQATNRFYEAQAAIEADKKAGKMPDRPLVDADFTRRRALNLPEAARFDMILKTPKDGNLGAALTAAMEAIEPGFPIWVPPTRLIVTQHRSAGNPTAFCNDGHAVSSD